MGIDQPWTYLDSSTVTDRDAFYQSPWNQPTYYDSTWPSGPAPLGQRNVYVQLTYAARAS